MQGPLLPIAVILLAASILIHANSKGQRFEVRMTRGAPVVIDTHTGKACAGSMAGGSICRRFAGGIEVYDQAGELCLPVGARVGPNGRCPVPVEGNPFDQFDLVEDDEGRP